MEKTVKMYTTSWCTYCKLAKDFFIQNNIKFEEIDVEGDMKAQEEMIKKSGQMGVPVIEVGDEIFVGFNKQGLAQALNIKV